MADFYQKLSEIDEFNSATPEDKIRFGQIYGRRMIESDERFSSNPELGEFITNKISSDIYAGLGISPGQEQAPQARPVSQAGPSAAPTFSETGMAIREDIEAITSRGFGENLGALGENAVDVFTHTLGIPGRFMAGLAQVPHAVASAGLEAAGFGDTAANQWIKAQYSWLDKSKKEMTVFNNALTKYEPDVLLAATTGAGVGTLTHKLTHRALNTASKLIGTPGYSAADAAIVSGWTAATGEAIVAAPGTMVANHWIDQSGYTPETKKTLKVVTPLLMGMFSGLTYEHAADRILRNPAVVDSVMKGMARGAGPEELAEEVRQIVKAPTLFDAAVRVGNGKVPPVLADKEYVDIFNVGVGPDYGKKITIVPDEAGFGKKITIVPEVQQRFTPVFGAKPRPTVVRMEEPGVVPSMDKPQGLYLNKAGQVTGVEAEMTERFDYDWHPSKPLDVESSNLWVAHARFRPMSKGPASAGIKALHSLVPEERFNELLKLNKDELISTVSKEFPKEDWARYFDSYEVLEGYAGKKARAAGHDGIVASDEVVALHRSAITVKEPAPVRLTPQQSLASDTVDAAMTRQTVVDILRKSSDADPEVAKQNYMDEVGKAWNNNLLSSSDAARITTVSDDTLNGWLFNSMPETIDDALKAINLTGQVDDSLGTLVGKQFNNEAGFVTPHMLMTTGAHAIPLMTGMEVVDGEMTWNVNKYLKYGAMWNALGFGGKVYRKIGGGQIARDVGSKVSRKFWNMVDNPWLNKFRPGGGLTPEVHELRKQFLAQKSSLTRKTDKFAIALAKNFKPSERELISDFIEKEKGWEEVPDLLQNQAREVQQFLRGIKANLIDSGVAPKDMDILGDEWLHRVYLPKLLKKPTYGTVRAKMKSIQGNYLKRRGKNRNLIKSLDDMGLEATDFKLGDKVYLGIGTGGKKRWVHKAQTDEMLMLHKRGDKTPEEWEVIKNDDGRLIVNRDYNKVERETMGESRDVAVRLAAFFRESAHDITLGNLFKNVASAPGLSQTKPAGMTKKAFEQSMKDQGFKKMPDVTTAHGVSKFGALSNQWVAPDVEKMLTRMTKKRYATEWEETWKTFYKRGLTTWKVGNTAFNPGTQVTNVLTNLHLCFFGGYNPAAVVIDGILALTRKDATFQKAIDAGLVDSGVMAGEWNLKNFTDAMGPIGSGMENAPVIAGAMGKAWNLAKGIAKLPMRSYQWGDEVFKLGVFKQQLAKGKSPEESLAEANKWFFDYSDVPEGVEFLRDTGLVPFVSFTYKVIPALVQGAAERPDRMIATVMAYKGLNDYIYQRQFGEKAEAQAKLEHELRPDYLKKKMFGTSVPSQIRLMDDPSTGEARSLDVGKYLPGSDLFTGMAESFPFGFHPLASLAFGATSGKHAVFGTEIVPYPKAKNAYQEGQNFDAWSKFVVNSLLPNIPGILYTYSSDRIGNALIMTGDINEDSGWLWDYSQRRGWNGKNYFGNDVNLGEEVLSTLGVRINRMDVGKAVIKEKVRRAGAYTTAKAELTKVFTDRNTTQGRRKAALAGYHEQKGMASQELQNLTHLIKAAR